MPAYRLGAVVYHPKVRADLGRTSAPGSASRASPLAAALLRRATTTSSTPARRRAGHGLEHQPRPRAGAADAPRGEARRAGHARHRPRLAQPDRGARGLRLAQPRRSAGPPRRVRRRRLAAGADPARPRAARGRALTRMRDCVPPGSTAISASTATPAAPSSRSSRACAPASSTPACVSSVTLDAVERLGDATGLRTVWTLAAVSPLLLHRRRRPPSATSASRELLFAMDVSDPKLCEPMELEYVNRWLPFDPSGYRDLIDAVAAPGRSSSVRPESPREHRRPSLASWRAPSAALRIFFGLILFSNGLAKLFAFTHGRRSAPTRRPDRPARSARDPRLRGQPARRRHRRAAAADARQRRHARQLGRLAVARRPRSSSAPALALILGIASRGAALVALGQQLFLQLVYLSSGRCMCEQPHEWVPLVILALVPAGRVWGLDARFARRGRRFDRWPF